MTRLSITGESRVTPENMARLERSLGRLWEGRAAIGGIDLVVTGACVGVDTAVGRWFVENHPEVPQLVLVPDDRSRVNFWWEDYLDAPIEARFGCGSYMERNDALVAEGDRLIAFSRTPEERLRSGTWATVRRARKAGKPVDVLALQAE